MRHAAKKVNWILSTQFGFNIRRVMRSLRGMPRFLADWQQFRKVYSGEIELQPCLYDWYEEGGSAKDEYFWQDLYVARKIFSAKPARHVDIGSRVDGFVAHVASFRNIEVFDVRPITAQIPGIIFRQADLMVVDSTLDSCCDSLSCLHALEHFGLGRYGDPLDANGSSKGLSQMAKLLRGGGIFYLAVPVGRERVVFNANRVFDPRAIVSIAADNGLDLKAFASFGPSRTLVESIDPAGDMVKLAQDDYALGIFTFTKVTVGL